MSMKVTFINVGYGEAILLQCADAARPGGVFTALVDGGSAEDAEYDGAGRVRAADYLRHAGVKRLDLLVNTHIHEDHTSGLAEVARAFPPAAFWCGMPANPAWLPLPQALAQSESTHKFLTAFNDNLAIARMLAASGIPTTTLDGSGGTLPLCAGLQAEVLAPAAPLARDVSARLAALADPAIPLEERRVLLASLDGGMNNASIVLRLHYAGKRLLLVGDTNRGGCAALEAERPGALRAEVFKLGHHGQRDSLSPETLAAADPEVAVICASSNSKYGSNHPEVLAALRRHGEARGRPVRILFSDAPSIPPFTDGLSPHAAAVVEIMDDGALRTGYQPPI